MIADPETRLSRPRQLYIGSGERQFVRLADRTTHPPLVG
jgi:citrate synthase